MPKLMLSGRTPNEPIRAGDIIDAQECECGAANLGRHAVRPMRLVRNGGRGDNVQGTFIKPGDVGLTAVIHGIGSLRVGNVQLDIRIAEILLRLRYLIRLEGLFLVVGKALPIVHRLVIDDVNLDYDQLWLCRLTPSVPL